MTFTTVTTGQFKSIHRRLNREAGRFVVRLHRPSSPNQCLLVPYVMPIIVDASFSQLHPSLTLAHTFLRRTGGGGTGNQGVTEVIAEYRPELHRYMYCETSYCVFDRVRVSLDTCTCASPTRSAPMAPC